MTRSLHHPACTSSHSPPDNRFCCSSVYSRYAISLAFKTILRLGECSPYILRGLNLVATVLVAMAASSCRNLVEAQLATQSGKPSCKPGSSFYAYHTSLNIALFPVIFFFSGLYYTDLYSTLVVLYAYHVHLERLGAPDGGSVAQDLWTVVVGVFALAMRQTNVFWVVVYMGGLEAVHAIKTLRPGPVEKPVPTSILETARFYFWRYSIGDIHDPPLTLSCPDGMRPWSCMALRC